MAKSTAQSANQASERELNWLPVKECRWNMSVQFVGGLGAKTKVLNGEQGCKLYAHPEHNGAVKIVLANGVEQVAPNAMVYTLA